MSTEHQELAESVATWLHYKSLTGLRDLLNESSMTLPIAEFLAAKHGKEVKAEVAHPLFKKAEPGRPMQIDFVRMRHKEKTWHAAYECKFATTNQSLIVKDICRLVCLRQSNEVGAVDRFLVYAGEFKPGGRLMSSMFNTGEGRRQAFFEGMLREGDLNEEDRRISFKIKDLSKQQRGPFVDFSKTNKARIPSQMVTELYGWAVSGRLACGIWRITQEQGSSLLSHSDLKRL